MAALVRIFDCDFVATGQAADMVQHCGDGRIGTGDGAVDALVRQQQRALDPGCSHSASKRRADRRRIIKPGELVKRGNAEKQLIHAPRHSSLRANANSARCENPCQPAVHHRGGGIIGLAQFAVDLHMAAQAPPAKALHHGEGARSPQGRAQCFALRRAIIALDMEDQEFGRIRPFGVEGGGKRPLARSFGAEGLDIGILHEIAAFGDLARDIITGPIQR